MGGDFSGCSVPSDLSRRQKLAEWFRRSASRLANIMHQDHRSFCRENTLSAILRWIRSGYYRKSGFAQQIDLDIHGRMFFAKIIRPYDAGNGQPDRELLGLD